MREWGAKTKDRFILGTQRQREREREAPLFARTSSLSPMDAAIAYRTNRLTAPPTEMKKGLEIGLLWLSSGIICDDVREGPDVLPLGLAWIHHRKAFWGNKQVHSGSYASNERRAKSFFVSLTSQRAN